MPRPRSFDTDAVLDRALDAFWERGFAATGIAHLTQATGLLPGSLYAAFTDKDEIFRRALERYARWLVAELPAGVEGLEGVEAAFDALVRLTVADPKRRGCPMVNAIAEADLLSARTRRLLDDGLAWMRDWFRERLLEEERRSGPAADVESLAALLFASAVAIRVLGRSKLDERFLRRIGDGATAAARRAFPARGKRRRARSRTRSTRHEETKGDRR